MRAEAHDPAGPLKVLHVDDDPMNLRVVKDILSAFGFSPFQAGSGPEALDLLGREAFDLVLMDIHMPQMGGVEVVRRLRESVGPERLTPVIALTADVMSRTPAQYKALGFDDYVAKPILVSRLHEAITAVVRGRPTEEPILRSA